MSGTQDDHKNRKFDEKNLLELARATKKKLGIQPQNAQNNQLAARAILDLKDLVDRIKKSNPQKISDKIERYLNRPKE